jgi:hypothetical protein
MVTADDAPLEMIERSIKSNCLAASPSNVL